MNELYRHNQSGYAILVVFSLGVIVITYPGLAGNFDGSLLFVLTVVCIVCLLLFSSLTVMVNKDRILIKFGLGIIKKEIPISDIESCKKVKNPWWYGWGIHITPDGWLYNVSGLNAIEIKMKNGRRCRIGTDEPGELERVLHNALIILNK